MAAVGAWFHVVLFLVPAVHPGFHHQTSFLSLVEIGEEGPDGIGEAAAAGRKVGPVQPRPGSFVRVP